MDSSSGIFMGFLWVFILHHFFIICIPNDTFSLGGIVAPYMHKAYPGFMQMTCIMQLKYLIITHSANLPLLTIQINSESARDKKTSLRILMRLSLKNVYNPYRQCRYLLPLYLHALAFEAQLHTRLAYLRPHFFSHNPHNDYTSTLLHPPAIGQRAMSR